MSKFHAIYGKGGDTPSGNTYGEVQTLLWENSSPKVNFGDKKIELDLSTYDGIIVEYLDNSSSSVQSIISRLKVEKNITNNYGAGFVSGVVSGVARNITAVNDTGVTLGNAFSSTETNEYVIPFRIYGYKQYETGSVAGDHDSVNVSANTDVQLTAGKYYLFLAATNTSTLVFTKGAVITSLTDNVSGGSYAQGAIITPDSNGVINVTNIDGKVKRLSVGD